MSKAGFFYLVIDQNFILALTIGAEGNWLIRFINHEEIFLSTLLKIKFSTSNFLLFIKIIVIVDHQK